MNSEQINAVAGPSNLRLSLSPGPAPVASTSTPHSPAPLFLTPPGPSPPKRHLSGTQELLSRFQLLSAYDKYVRPFATQYDQNGRVLFAPGASSLVDKGKGKEIFPSPNAAQGPTPNGPVSGIPEVEEEEGIVGKGEKRKKNTYKTLIKGIPGKHSMKKDDYLTSTMMVPPKPRTRIRQFDLRTQQEAFAVSLEGLKGWNVTALILESPQAREDRKKRKELKRLAKAQQQAQAAAMQAGSSPVVAQPQPLQASASNTPRPTSTSAQAAPTSGTATPRPVGTPRPISTIPRPGSTIPRPISTVPRPGSTAPKQDGLQGKVAQALTGIAATPARTATPVNAGEMRGVKREWEDVASIPANGNGNMHGGSDSYANANGSVNGVGRTIKAGIVGVRPRPAKKQRTDMQGQARDVSAPIQQPTPQGV